MTPGVCPACGKPMPAESVRCPSCGHQDKTLSQTVPMDLQSGTPAPEAGPGTPAATPVRLGQYRLLRELGRGGMGRVLEAVDEPLGRRVAVKVVLQPSSEQDRRRNQRFIEEARIAGCLEHPGIAPVYNLGRNPDGSVYFSMKLVAGRDLHDILNDRQRGEPNVLREYTLSRLLSVFERVVETVAYAHSQGILHRDLKPNNVMVGAHGEVWVMDWGLAKVVGRSESEPTSSQAVTASLPAGFHQEQTVPGALVGTPQYMAPEQAKGHALDVRTDIFGLGGILYKMLTGQAPHQGVDAMGTLMSAALGQISPVRSTAEGRQAPPALAAIAEKCLAAQPENRYASAADLLADLRAYAADETIRAYPESRLDRLLRLARRHRRVAAIMGGLATLLLVGWTLFTTIIAAKDRRALEAERDARTMQEKAQSAELARQAALADSAARAQRRMNAFKPYAEAADLLARGQLFDQAAQRLEEALRIDPEFPEAQFALGEALRLSGLPDRAAPAYEQANELSRKITGKPHLQALLAAGMAYDGGGDYYRSEQLFAQAEREGADHPLALVGKSLRLSHERRLKEARVAAEEALARGPHLWETHFAAGFILSEAIELGLVAPEPGRTQAIAHMRRALELSPRQAETCVWLARALIHAGTPEHRSEGIRLMDRAIALEPQNGNRYISRGMTRQALGDAKSAAADFKKARDLAAHRSLLLYVDASMASRSDPETAFKLMGELLRTTHDWPPHVGNWLGLAWQTGRLKETRGKLDEWCKRNPEYPETYALKAQIKARDGDVPGALAEDRAGLKVAPFNRKLRTLLAVHLQMMRKWSESLVAADAVLEIAPGDFLGQTTRARALAELGRGAEAKAIIDRLLQDFPGRAKEIEDLRRSVENKLPK